MAAGADPRHRDGPRLPRARARPEPHRRDAEAGRDPLPRYARARASPARRRDERHEARRHASRRDRLQALRHLRLPLRPHRGRAQSPRHRRRHQGICRMHGAPARRGAEVLGRLRRGRDRDLVVRAEGRARRHRVPRLRRRGLLRRDRGADQGRQARLRAQGGRARHRHRQPDALLCASRADRSATAG